jgi:hypothetical protein
VDVLNISFCEKGHFLGAKFALDAVRDFAIFLCVVGSSFLASMIPLVVNILDHVVIVADVNVIRALLGVFMLCPDSFAFDFSR